MPNISIFLPRNLVKRGDLILYRVDEGDTPTPSRKSPLMFSGFTDKGTKIELITTSSRQFWEDSQQGDPDRVCLWKRLFLVLSENPVGGVLANGEFVEIAPIVSQQISF